MPNNCPFCDLGSMEDVDARPKIENTILCESKHFLVVPSLGPLTLGHVLVVSRLHSSCLAGMGEEAMIEYDQLLRAISARLDLYGQDLLQAEHGSAESGSGGACIAHTHINLLPQLGGFVRMFADPLPKIENIFYIHDMQSVRNPYIMLRNDSEPPRVFCALGVPSQLVRRRICENVGRDDWDWAVFPNYNLISETIQLWKKTSLPIKIAY